MTKIFRLVKRLTTDESGATLIEYTVLIGIMLVAVIAAIIAIGTWVSDKWTALNTALNG
jgi:pilus assembly protein Flp/PilA